jgi:hypothetical protein
MNFGAFYIRLQFWRSLLIPSLCSFAFLLSGLILVSEEKRTHNLFELVRQAHAELGAKHLLSAEIPVPYTNTSMEPVNWPLRADVNEFLRHAGETAQARGVALRTISVSHQAASVQAWGRINLDVSAYGRYAALKAWQSAMQQRSSSLSVQSLRLQGSASSGSGDLDAQAIWVLHVRD